MPGEEEKTGSLKGPRFWIALGENQFFTRDDHYLFYVFYTGQKNGSGYPLMPKFVSAANLEEARRKLHAFVDERIDHAIHMAKLEVAEPVKKSPPARIPYKEEAVDSLTITGVGQDVQASPSISSELNDIFGDISGDSK